LVERTTLAASFRGALASQSSSVPKIRTYFRRAILKASNHIPPIINSYSLQPTSNDSFIILVTKKRIDSPALFRYLNSNRLCSHWCGWFNKKSIRKSYQDYDPTNFYPNITNSANFHRFSTIRDS